MNHFHWDSIIKYMKKKESASPADIARLCGITLPTARKYLSIMHEERLLYFSRGKAERMPQNYATVLGWRSLDHKDEKKSIGKKAASLIKDGETIFIGGGSTAAAVLDFMEDKKDITLVTNSIYVLNKAVLLPHVHLICTGGVWASETNTFAGNISHIYGILSPHRAFFGVMGLDSARGVVQNLNTDRQDEILIAERAKETYFLADLSKFNQFYPWTAFPMTNIKNIITTDGLPEQDISLWVENGTSIIFA